MPGSSFGTGKPKPALSAPGKPGYDWATPGNGWPSATGDVAPVSEATVIEAIPESSRAQPYAQLAGTTVAPSFGMSRKPNGGLDVSPTVAAAPVAACAEVDGATVGSAPDAVPPAFSDF